MKSRRSEVLSKTPNKVISGPKKALLAGLAGSMMLTACSRGTPESDMSDPVCVVDVTDPETYTFKDGEGINNAATAQGVDVVRDDCAEEFEAGVETLNPDEPTPIIPGRGETLIVPSVEKGTN